MVFLSRTVEKKLFLLSPAFLTCLSLSCKKQAVPYDKLYIAAEISANNLLQKSTKYSLGFVCIGFKTATTIKRSPQIDFVLIVM